MCVVYTKQTRRIIFLYQQKIIVRLHSLFLLDTTIFSICMMIKKLVFLQYLIWIPLHLSHLLLDSYTKLCSCWKMLLWARARRQQFARARRQERWSNSYCICAGVTKLSLNTQLWPKRKRFLSAAAENRASETKGSKDSAVKWWIVGWNLVLRK